MRCLGRDHNDRKLIKYQKHHELDESCVPLPSTKANIIGAAGDCTGIYGQQNPTGTKLYYRATQSLEFSDNIASLFTFSLKLYYNYNYNYNYIIYYITEQLIH